MTAHTGSPAAHETSPAPAGVRTYAIPFERVWQAALALAQGGLRGWHVLQADDYEGVIVAQVRAGLLRRSTHAVVVRIGLDADGQTRVAGTGPHPAARRHTARFLQALDQALLRR